MIPGELATSLTHSLLNQPHPLPLFPHQIPLPASEVRSRKENRQTQLPVAAASPTSESPTATLLENRKFSQPPFSILGTAGTVRTRSGSRVSSNSPSTGPAFSASASRNISSGEFGVNITNMSEPPQSAVNASMGVGSEKGLRCVHTFTPVSANPTNDDDDDSLRPSSHLQLSPYSGENEADG